jgi:hypothetical protein
MASVGTAVVFGAVEFFFLASGAPLAGGIPPLSHQDDL